MKVHPHCCQAASISLLPAHSASDGWLRSRRTFSIASCRTFSTKAESPGYMLQANMKSCQTSSPSSSQIA